MIKQNKGGNMKYLMFGVIGLLLIGLVGAIGITEKSFTATKFDKNKLDKTALDKMQEMKLDTKDIQTASIVCKEVCYADVTLNKNGKSKIRISIVPYEKRDGKSVRLTDAEIQKKIDDIMYQRIKIQAENWKGKK